jgi:endonuclease-3
MPDLRSVVAGLLKYYGKPAAPITRYPFELVLLEKSGYLTTDEKRERAFRELRKRVGTSPAKIRRASFELLQEIAAMGGIHADTRALRMQQSAELALKEDPSAAVKLEFKQARKAMARYPMIGEPGAEKILLFSGAHRVLALESNGRAQEALDITGWTGPQLIVAHQLLRRHGQETCRRSDPQCATCPVKRNCRFVQLRAEGIVTG